MFSTGASLNSGQELRQAQFDACYYNNFLILQQFKISSYTIPKSK